MMECQTRCTIPKLAKVVVFGLLTAAQFLPSGSSNVYAGDTTPPAFVGWPEKGLGLAIDLTGFKVDFDQIKPDGRRYLMASHPKTGLNVSVTVEKGPGPASTSECVRHLQQLQKGPFASRGQDINLTTTGTIPTLEYTFREFQGAGLDQENIYACLAQDHVYADLHLSKVHYTPTDVPLFQSLLETIHFQRGPGQHVQAQAPTTLTSLQLFRMGSAWYLQHKYDQAIPPYQKALDLENTHPQLDKTLWRVLVDNLGMAYGMTNRLNEAKATFEQGILADPTYPMFHYNLACTYAEMNDLERATQSLRTAFQYRKNQNPGESMPDPRQDSSFQRFMKHEAFRKLMNELTAMTS